MGCNQSKAAGDAVLNLADEGIIPPPTGLKMSSSTSPSSRGGTNPCSSGEGADLTPNGTLSSDDNDVVLAVLSNDASTPKSDASPSPLSMKTDNADDMNCSPREAPTSPVQKEEAPSDPEQVTSSSSPAEDLPSTTRPTESPQSPKSPRRRRRRSNSGGVKAMQELAAVEDEEEKARQQVHVQPALQPVVAKNVEKSIPEIKVETSTPQPEEEKVPSVTTKTEELVDGTVETGDLESTGQAAEATKVKTEDEKASSDSTTTTITTATSPDQLAEETEIETEEYLPTDPISNAKLLMLEESPQPPAESENGETEAIQDKVLDDDVSPLKSTEKMTVGDKEGVDEVSIPVEDASSKEIEAEVEQTEKVEEESPKDNEATDALPSTQAETFVEPAGRPDLETTTPKKEKADDSTGGEEPPTTLEETEPSPQTPSKSVVEPAKMKNLSDMDTPTPKKEKICAGCSVPESECGGTPFKYCARCKAVAYCGRECQIAHWKQHKKVCGGSSLTKEMSSSSNLTAEAWEGQLNNTSSSPSNSSVASSSNNTEELFREHFLHHHESPMSYSSSSRASIHEEAVRELEAVLRRLRSNDPDFHNSTDEYDDEEDDDEINKSLEEINVSLLKSPSPAKSVISESNSAVADDVATTRESPVLQSPSSSTLPPVDVNSSAALSPLPSSPRPFDENTPILLPPIRRCAGCNTIEKALGAYKDCAKCRSVIYCNKKCQKAHWKEHKKTCCKTDSSRMSLTG